MGERERERETSSSELWYSVVCLYVCMYVHVQVYILWDFFKISIEDQLGALRAPKLPTYGLVQYELARRSFVLFNQRYHSSISTY